GHPNGLQMAANKVLVRQVQRRRPDLAMHHGRWVGEEELVVWATRSGIGEHKRWHAAAPSSAAALGVVGWRGWHVAQVDRVQRRNVDAEFHRRRAVEDGQEALGLAQFAQARGVGLEFGLLLGAVAESQLADGAPFAFDLRGVLAGFESEEAV